MSRYLSLIAFLVMTMTGVRADTLPWQRWVDKAEVAELKSLESVFDMKWETSGDKECTLAVSPDKGPWGGKMFQFDVEIDHYNEAVYPQAWPSFQTTTIQDWSGYQTLRFWLRCDTDNAKAPIPLRIILWTNGAGALDMIMPGIKTNEWQQISVSIRNLQNLNKLDRFHFFMCECDFQHGDKMKFQMGGFELCRFEQELTTVPPNEAGVALWAGKDHTSERIAMYDKGATVMPVELGIETGKDLALRASDEIVYRLRNVFDGKEITRTRKLGQDIAAGQQCVWVKTQFEIAGLEPSYYLAVADIQRNGKSLLYDLIGADDFYIRQPDEDMSYSVLSIRTGMVQWLRDLLYGDIMGWAYASMPHVYDPLNPETYAAFVKLAIASSGKHTEGNEAGDTGLAYAAEAFRKAGDVKRQKFTEWLMKDSFKHMIERMQSPSGGCIMYTDELGDVGIGNNRSQAWGSYDTNQTGEWMRAITYGILYFAQDPTQVEYAKELSKAVRRSADFLVKYAAQDSDGLAQVIRHLSVTELPNGEMKQNTYFQEGRQCDVYLGRALSGLSYYAYAMQVLGEKVPDDWWPVLENSVEWSKRKMKPNGWFDWQCEDIVEGGCHTFLGNIYIAEGVWGVYLAQRMAGRTEQAKESAEIARIQYRYVTDDCFIKGKQYDVPSAAEFWVGPYVYWLYTQYVDTMGAEPGLQGWLDGLDDLWSKEHNWKDFLDRSRSEDGYVGRSSANGMLNVAVLAYPAIKWMEENKRPTDIAVIK